MRGAELISAQFHDERFIDRRGGDLVVQPPTELVDVLVEAHRRSNVALARPDGTHLFQRQREKDGGASINPKGGSDSQEPASASCPEARPAQRGCVLARSRSASTDRLIVAKYDGSQARRSPGRPPTANDVTEQLFMMARESPSWGYTRLRGALRDLGFDVGRSTIQRILRQNGIEPAPRRRKTLSWSAFLRAHWGAIAAADFFSVEVVTVGGLVRYFVFFVIDLKTRSVHVAGLSNSPDGAWMAQVGRNLTDATSGFLRKARHLIVDRDPLYTPQFQALLASANVELLRLPARSPNLNARAERFVGSIKSECLRQSSLWVSSTRERSSASTWNTITTSGTTRASATSFPCRSRGPATAPFDDTNDSVASSAITAARPPEMRSAEFSDSTGRSSDRARRETPSACNHL